MILMLLAISVVLIAAGCFHGGNADEGKDGFIGDNDSETAGRKEKDPDGSDRKTPSVTDGFGTVPGTEWDSGDGFVTDDKMSDMTPETDRPHYDGTNPTDTIGRDPESTVSIPGDSVNNDVIGPGVPGGTGGAAANGNTAGR